MFDFFPKFFRCSLVVLAASSVGVAVVPPLKTSAHPLGAVAIAAQPAVDVPFEVCGEAQTWVRPTKAEQAKKLQSLPRYAGDLANQPLQGVAQRFWQQKIFSFTQYGLSLRMEPIYLSGLWSVQDTLWKCYNADNVTQINTGKTAEVWVLSHRVTRIRWTGEQYVMVVQPAQAGVQFIQFPRRESRSALPLKVVTEMGAKLTVVAGN
ncbi:hypothetical protein [Stenomitos frigidus]|uniref:Uncharacterized protein n=1 Tax=Stenomitos frigidus ULC18 TaxID=2107698 RepID=A0A2T1EGS3_9CYAN|nr:hypothetical protein [Stenomitos frigidus]PSB31903.1 hypothetical protein C7B82_06730 [Stenomitos frigidus ULC18]